MSTGSVKAYGSDSDVSFVAEVALATNYTAVKLGSDANSVDLNDAVTDQGLGITQVEQATVDGLVTVRVAGFSLAVCSGGWTKGDYLVGTTAGALLTTTTASDRVAAVAMETVATTEN